MTEREYVSLVERMKDRMFRLARRILCDGVQAEDLIQDVFEKLWVRREELSAMDNEEAFMYVTVRNRCLDRLRSKKTRDYPIEAATQKVAGEGSAGEYSDIKNHIEVLISRLPEKQRTVIHLRDIEGESTERIAQITGSEETAVRMTLSRARKTVREQLMKIMDHGTI